MKQLIIAHTKDSYYTLPPEMRMQLLEEAGAFVDKYLKVGKCKEIYIVPGLKMRVSIWEVESPEETNRICLEAPTYPFEDYEVYALSDFASHMKAAREVVQQRLVKE